MSALPHGRALRKTALGLAVGLLPCILFVACDREIAVSGTPSDAPKPVGDLRTTQRDAAPEEVFRNPMGDGRISRTGRDPDVRPQDPAQTGPADRRSLDAGPEERGSERPFRVEGD